VPAKPGVGTTIRAHGRPAITYPPGIAPLPREAQQNAVREPRPRSSDFVRSAGLAAAFALIVGACGSAGSAGWTYAPEPSPTAAPSAAPASGAPSAAATPAASGSAGASASAGSSAAVPSASSSAPSGNGTGAATTVQISALNIAFDTTTIQAPAGQPFSIDFDNQDSGIPHNIDIKDPSGNSVFKGNIVTGPTKTTYQVPGLTKGTAYTFNCDVHPNMTGTVVVQ
jgi:plastocyanin